MTTEQSGELLLKLLTSPPVSWLCPGRVETFNLPTPQLITAPVLAVPLQGRFWALELYLRDQRLLPYSQLRQCPDFRGTSHEMQIHMYEVWEDMGDDGHTDYRLRGWTLYPGRFPREPHRIGEECRGTC
jgi:hypothetical protein